MEGYSKGEVVWLFALTRRDAIEEDLPGAASLQPGSGDGDADRVPTLPRWSEVRDARDRVAARKAESLRAVLAGELVTLIARGYTQAEAAELMEVSQQTVSRQVRARLDEILEELNGRTAPVGIQIRRPERPHQVVRILTAAAAA